MFVDPQTTNGYHVLVKVHEAAAEVADQLEALGLTASANDTRVTVTASGLTCHLLVVAASVARDVPADHDGAPVVVVADRISKTLRAALNDVGVSWYDRRGHLRIRVPGVWIDTDVPAAADVEEGGVRPLAGPVIAAVSIGALSAYPRPLAGVRAVARDIDASPGGVSIALQRLERAGLITHERRAAVPGLFTAVADDWVPTWHPLPEIPASADDIVAAGGHAAAALGAPLVVTRSQPLELVAADAVVLRRILRGVPSVSRRPAATIAVGPAPFAARPYGDIVVKGHRCAQPVISALVLAQDPARGRETIEGWRFDGRSW